MGGWVSSNYTPPLAGRPNPMWFTYVIRSLKDGRYYIGYSSDVQKRIITHNTGGCASTRHRKPFELVHVEEYTTKIEAMTRERQIKRYKGGEAFKKLIANRAGGRVVNYTPPKAGRPIY